MVDAGVEKVLITSPVVTREKIDRVVALAKRSPGVEIVVDQEKNARDFGDAAAAAGIRLSVLIDLNVGTDRTGISMGKPALALAEAIGRTRSLRFGAARSDVTLPGRASRSRDSRGPKSASCSGLRAAPPAGDEVDSIPDPKRSAKGST